jgi:hypothetical protein
MFVHPTRHLTLGAVLGGTLALAACDAPTANTDLRPEGPPDVLAVLVFNDPANSVIETGTYCKENDPKRPEKVGIPAFGLAPVVCPEGGAAAPVLTDADPNAWYVRVMFDELLDPSVETLEPILDAMGNETDTFTGSLKTTQPVTLKCQDVNRNLASVPYDGYYSPAGNAVTWPVGPSLVIKPLDPTIVPVESECEITLKKDAIKDKDGVAIADADVRPFKFKIAPISFIPAAQGPVDGDVVDPSADEADFIFNVETDGTAIPGAEPCGDPAVPATCFKVEPAAQATDVGAADFGVGIALFWSFVDDVEYTVTPPTMLKATDKCGIVSTVANLPTEFKFKTNKMRITAINPAGGNAVAASKKITVSFNQVILAETFTETTDWTLSPKPANFAVSKTTGAATSISMLGDYNLNTNYVFTVKSGAQITDAKPSAKVLSLTADQVSNYTTVPTIAVTAQSPNEGARILQSMAAPAAVRLTFNQEILAGSLTEDEFTITKADGSAVTGVTPTITIAGAAATMRFPGLAPGGYTFTLKMGATVTDKIVPPNTYTAAQDRVIHFIVADAPPPPDAFSCLGATP